MDVIWRRCCVLAIGWLLSAQVLAEVMGITAITDIGGDGQILAAVAIEYDRPVNGSSLLSSGFTVPGRRIERVYTNDRADMASEEVPGPFVIIELDPDQDAALLYEHNGWVGHRSQPEIAIRQIEALQSADGEYIAPMPRLVVNNAVHNRVLDDFVRRDYYDEKTRKTLRYNLFIPRDYDPRKPWPLVWFAHDASTTTSDVQTTLIQGNGGAVWASASDQQSRPAFVVAPQFDTRVITGEYEASEYLEISLALIRSLQQEFNIDNRRVYGTGQGEGAMLTIAMALENQDLFAATYLVGGQWDPRKMTRLADLPMWIVVAEADPEAWPEMKLATDMLEDDGEDVARASWRVDLPAEMMEQQARAVADDPAHIKFVSLQRAGLVPSDLPDTAAYNHRYSWHVAYNWPVVRQWLFDQRKNF